jgi:hypothetical protein
VTRAGLALSADLARQPARPPSNPPADLAMGSRQQTGPPRTLPARTRQASDVRYPGEPLAGLQSALRLAADVGMMGLESRKETERTLSLLKC